MLEEIKEQARAAVLELLESARLSRGDILVVGCSSSEVMGGRIGAASSTQAAAAVFAGIYPVLCQNGIYLAAPVLRAPQPGVGCGAGACAGLWHAAHCP